MILDRDAILEVLTPDLENGRLYWKRPHKYHAEKVGREAGAPRPNRNGKIYWIIGINGRRYRRGWLVYCIVHGRFPNPCLDHISGDSLDDRPNNIREATVTQNAWNHSKRARRIKLPMGVRLVAASGRFEARIGFHNRQLHLGAYDTAEEAQATYQAKRRELYGEFA